VYNIALCVMVSFHVFPHLVALTLSFVNISRALLLLSFEGGHCQDYDMIWYADLFSYSTTFFGLGNVLFWWVSWSAAGRMRVASWFVWVSGVC